MRKALAGAGILLGLALALFFYLKFKGQENPAAETRNAGQPTAARQESPEEALASGSPQEARPSSEAPVPDVTPEEADENPDNQVPLNPHEEMQAIEKMAASGEFPYSELARILRALYPRDVKFMALQAFVEAHHIQRDEVYANSKAVLQFLRKTMGEWREQDLPIIGQTLEILNDAQNPNKKAVDEFLRAEFEAARGKDPQRAALFLNAMGDLDLLKSIAGNAQDPLQNNAKNRLPQVAGAGLLREILNDKNYSVNQKLIGMTQLAQKAESGGEALSLKQTLDEARRLDEVHGQGNRFYQQALQGISLANVDGKDPFFAGLLKEGLSPHRGKAAGTGPRFSEVPELMAIFGYLTSVQPDESAVYAGIRQEWKNDLQKKTCTRDRAAQLLADFISFWQMACERSPDCTAKAKSQAAYIAVMGEAKQRKALCAPH